MRQVVIGILCNKKNAFTAYINDTYKFHYSNNNSYNNIKYALSGRYDKKEISLFENGNKTSENIQGTIKKTSGNTIMALATSPSENIAYSEFFNGTIYSVRIYNRALTDEEVMQNYKIDKMLYGVEDINE